MNDHKSIRVRQVDWISSTAKVGVGVILAAFVVVLLLLAVFN